jgi:signal transduction histidine kinase
MKTRFGKNLFAIVVICAVIINLGFDLLAYGSIRPADHLTVYAVTVDILIVLMLGFLFWREQVARNEVEAILRRTSEHLESANDLLLQADLVRNRLLRSTVHDLKNPLGTIRGFADLIGTESKDHSSVQQMSDRIRRVSDHTLELVNSLLSPEVLVYGQIPLNKKEVKLNAFVKDVQESLKILAKEKQQNFKCHLQAPNVSVCVDPLRFRDVIFNIGGNAIKFSPSGASITLGTQFIGDKLVVFVDDEGPGFSAEDKEKAFLEGQTLSAQPTGGEVSTGMGLFSAQRNIQLHGGTIKITDNPAGRGSRLIIELP